MKKIFYFILFTAVLFSSCSNELDLQPISSATTETFYQSTNDFISGVNAVYSDLRAYPDRLLNLSETRSDNLYAVSDGGVRDWEGINSFHKTIAANPYVSEAWLSDYNGIYRANVVLDKLTTNGSVITDATLRKRLEAETKFLRAFYYFDLVRWFGKVPVITTPVSVADALTIPRSPVTDVYTQIISDLQFAVTNLPETYATADKGRVTKFAAQGTLALVYMTRSGPTYNIEGPGLGLNEWNQALALLNTIVSSGKFSMLAKYSDIFSYTNESNAEVVFDIQYITGQSPVVGATFPWVLSPDTWFQANGKPAQGSLTIRPASSLFVSSFETGDTRKDFSIVQSYTYNGVIEVRPFLRKYVDLTKVPTNNKDYPINFIALRYTDVLMLKAECILNGATSGTQADVDAIVNSVRKRAGLTTTVSNVTKAQLMTERQKEFNAEGSRWHDLVRSGLVESTMTNFIKDVDVLKQMQPFQTNYIIYPIPQSEIDVKNGLYTQNAGY